jgi:hypothetical protein
MRSATLYLQVVKKKNFLFYTNRKIQQRFSGEIWFGKYSAVTLFSVSCQQGITIRPVRVIGHVMDDALSRTKSQPVDACVHQS